MKSSQGYPAKYPMEFFGVWTDRRRRLQGLVFNYHGSCRSLHIPAINGDWCIDSVTLTRGSGVTSETKVSHCYVRFSSNGVSPCRRVDRILVHSGKCGQTHSFQMKGRLIHTTTVLFNEADEGVG